MSGIWKGRLPLSAGKPPRYSGRKIERAKITAQNIENYLGVPRFRYGLAEKENEMGVATGLAVTEVGGDVLSVKLF